MTNYKPVKGQVYLCKIMHFETKEVQEHLLKYVDEADCSWHTANGKGALDEWSWQVVTFKSVEGSNVTK